MATRFTCSCGKQLQVKSEMEGKRIQCPACRQVSRVSNFPAGGRVRVEGNMTGSVATALPQNVDTADQAGPTSIAVEPTLLRRTPIGPHDVDKNETLALAPNPASGSCSARPRIEGYEILEELGRGGMGVVYQARNLQQKRLVALKMILVGGHAGPEQLARFRTEAQAIARLQHPNIVQLYEFGESEGRPFFSLEFLEAGSLADQLDGAPWPARKAARLVRTLARAVHHAHQCGIIHRDLKPANVLLAADGSPKITDFGLAKQLDASQGQTPSDAVLGTPSYMAPEQAGGQSKRVGPAADVYALGAILYELLTGQPPFSGDTPIDIIMQVVTDDPVSPRLLRPDLAGDLETICLKCLHK